jgi:hypothetical protein
MGRLACGAILSAPSAVVIPFDTGKPEQLTKIAANGEGHANHICGVFRYHERNEFYGYMFDKVTGAYVPGFAPAVIDAKGIKHLYAVHGSAPPSIDAIPPGEFKFEPGNPRPIQKLPSGAIVVNSWQEPAIRKQATPAAKCPAGIRALLLHVMGSDQTSLERFLNWLAVAYQRNGRTGTAWVWSGTQGTGKGLVVNEILRPLFGYVVTTLASAFKDQFNSQLERCTMLNVDECEFKGRDKSDAVEKLKVIITGETLSIRGMHQAAREVPNYCNVVLTSNSVVAADLPRDDRRFSVSPPQPVKLEKKYPDTDAIVATVRRELPAFAGFLAQFRADAALARTALASAAKDDMIEAGQTGPEAFARALIDGDLEYFVTEYQTLAQLPAGRDESSNREYFREAVTEWLEGFEPDTDIAVPTATACTIYNALFRPRPEMTPDGLGRFMSKQGLKSMQHRLGVRGRSYPVRWQAPTDIEADRADLTALRTGKFTE